MQGPIFRSKLSDASAALGSKHSSPNKACFVFMRASYQVYPLPLPFFWHCILQKTLDTVRHRKQVDNNKSDCGKSTRTRDQLFTCPVAFFDVFCTITPICLVVRACLLSPSFYVATFVNHFKLPHIACEKHINVLFHIFLSPLKDTRGFCSNTSQTSSFFFSYFRSPRAVWQRAAYSFKSSTRQKHLRFSF